MGILKLLSPARHGALPWPGRGSSPKTGTHAVSHLLSSLTTKTIARLGLRAARHFALCITAGLRLLLFPAKTLIFARFLRHGFRYSLNVASATPRSLLSRSSNSDKSERFGYLFKTNRQLSFLTHDLYGSKVFFFHLKTNTLEQSAQRFGGKPGPGPGFCAGGSQREV